MPAPTLFVEVVGRAAGFLTVIFAQVASALCGGLLLGLVAEVRCPRPDRREPPGEAVDASARLIASALLRIGAEMWEYEPATGAFTIRGPAGADRNAERDVGRLTRQEVLAGLHADDRDAFAHALDAVVAGRARSWRLVLRRRQPEGGFSWVEERAVALPATTASSA